MAATLVMYERRIRAMDQRHFDALAGTYLSTFDVYSTVPCEADGTIRPSLAMENCTALVIARVALDRGVRVAGITSERKSNGTYLCHTMPDGTPRSAAAVQYVGNFNYFTSHGPTPWSIKRCDKVYAVPDDDGDGAAGTDGDDGDEGA